MLIENQNYRGYDFEVHTDEDPMDPRKDWDNLGTMTCWHRRYVLGDAQWDEEQARAVKRAEAGGGLVSPVFIYDHSGITINTTGFSCPWDSGKVGYIYVTGKRIRQWFGWKRITEARRKRAWETLISEVNTYDQYLTGQVYGFVIPDMDESCWGFYGKDYMIEEVHSIIDHQVERDRKARQEHTKAMISNHVPLESRVS